MLELGGLQAGGCPQKNSSSHCLDMRKNDTRRCFREIAMKQSSHPDSEICYVFKFQPSRWTMALLRAIFLLRSLNKLHLQMALSKNKPCHFFWLPKIYLSTKFELSRWTMGPTRPIFLFWPVNILGPLVENSETEHVKTWGPPIRSLDSSLV